MKTVLQALSDEVHYPLSQGFYTNKLIMRGLTPNEEVSAETLNSVGFRGALADSLASLLFAPNISEAGISISLQDRQRILAIANGIYRDIGEREVNDTQPPKVKFL